MCGVPARRTVAPRSTVSHGGSELAESLRSESAGDGRIETLARIGGRCSIEGAERAARLQERGTAATTILYPEVNHGYFGERYPVEFKDTLLRIARFYTEHLGVAAEAWHELDKKIDDRVAGYFPQQTIDPDVLRGQWMGTQKNFEFVDERSGIWSDRRNTSKPFTYTLSDGFLTVHLEATDTILYLQQDGRALYEITQNDVRRTGQRFHFTRRSP